MKIPKPRQFFTILLLIFIFLPNHSNAATTAALQHFILDNKSTISDNAYIMGGVVNIEGTIDGDLTAVGSRVLLAGTTTKDILSAGNAIRITGNVQGDARIGARTVTIGGFIEEDLLAVGRNIQILPIAEISRDAILYGGTVRIDGTIKESVFIRAGAVIINAPILGSADIVADAVHFGPNARIYGNVEHQSRSIIIDNGAEVSGSITAVEKTGLGKFVRRGVFIRALGIIAFIKYLMFLLLGILLTIFLPTSTYDVIYRAKKHFALELFRGLVTFFVLPLTALLIGFSIIGGLLSIILILGLVIMSILAAAFGGILVGSLLQVYVRHEQKNRIDWITAILGITSISIVTFIPFIGPLITAIMFFVSFGAVTYLAFINFEEERL